MAQLFSPRSNILMRTGIIASLFAVVLTGWALYRGYWSPLLTREEVIINQPVPFSHEHHVSGLGIDCRYCHVSVETSAFAGIPPTETCMTCHSQIWTEAPMLEPVRRSYARNEPLSWQRVHNLPDFAYFNHGVHIQKGIGCSTCHGRVDRMPLVYQTETLYMKWCLDCHRAPQRFVRAPEDIFNFNWTPTNQPVMDDVSNRLVTSLLQDCSICHR